MCHINESRRICVEVCVRMRATCVFLTCHACCVARACSRTNYQERTPNIAFVTHLCVFLTCHACCTCILSQQLSGAHPHNRVRDSFICRLSDLMICRVRDLFIRMLIATNRRSPNVAFVTHSCVELLTHSYGKVVTYSYAEFVTHACVEFVTHLYVTHSQDTKVSR